MQNSPNASRYALSKLLCKEWNWIQPNGALRDMAARGFMLKLHKEGYIRLPDKKNNPNNPFINQKKPTKIKAGMAQIKPIEIKQVRNTPHEKLFNSLIEYHHYLGFYHPVEEQLKYMVFANKRPIACFLWSLVPRHIGARDRYIGWTKKRPG